MEFFKSKYFIGSQEGKAFLYVSCNVVARDIMPVRALGSRGNPSRLFSSAEHLVGSSVLIRK